MLFKRYKSNIIRKITRLIVIIKPKRRLKIVKVARKFISSSILPYLRIYAEGVHISAMEKLTYMHRDYNRFKLS